MRCRQCDYPLWSIADRTCPECGVAFRPSQFEFVPDTVKFCCPGCDQAYYGTSVRGHLDPVSFDCVSCDRAITMDETVLVPADGVAEERTVAERMPWLERAQIGFWPALFRTTVLSHFNPLKLARATPPASSVKASLLYAAIVLFGAYAIGLLPFLAIPMIGGGGAGGFIGLLTTAVVIFGALAVFVLLWVASAHGLLKLTGGSSHGIGRTFEAVLYSSGTNAMVAIPCLGPFVLSTVSWFWWPISAILMLKEGQRVHGGRATLAILVFPVALTMLGLAANIVFIFYVFRGMNAGQQTVPQATTALVELSEAIETYVADHGAYPAHGFALLATDLTSGDRLIGPGSALTPADLVLTDGGGASVTLTSFEGMSESERAELVVDVASGFPEGVLAHRVGDIVFTMHGMTPPAADPGLWLVVFAPEYGTTAPFNVSANTVIALCADGSTVDLTTNLATELQAQNVLRRRSGLGGLPGLRTIATGAPATPPPAPGPLPASEPASGQAPASPTGG